jgi:hypothetical protein
MKNLVIVLAIVLQQAYAADLSDMVDSSTALKWECVTTDSNHAPIEFTAVYDAASGVGYLEFGGERLYTKSKFFAKSSTWNPPDVSIYVLNGHVRFYGSGKHTRYVLARCVEL